jgi:hypothetical protein
MPSFTVRVELHKADEDDYANLHTEMEDRGFVRWIEGRDGSKDRLPTAEYNLVGSSLTRAEVRKQAEAAANAVKPNPTPWILVTEAAGRTWSGLKTWRD